ncbi:Methyltransferase [Magnetospirillum sp. LM-5]|uniref:class I SAM-dependent methyltransferase n=1 Tax=Magnetospirillum sp. LM-5 TaxID=2681466 RepID=UPI001381C0E8|nr:class I SAM-dependent methyltransferase [Magnetospirillum sp. LM-5]CAA7619068.1 Methyltransferase [Magnetospirillum sp. LM-5]
MAQLTTGIRAVLSHPLAYEAVQYLVGAKRCHRMILERHIKPVQGERILDIGCGPAEILRLLPAVDYVGIDASESYLARARASFGDRGRFLLGRISAAIGAGLGPFDLALAIGVLHHLDDDEALSLFDDAYQALAPGGRLFTADPCYFPGQSWLHRFVISKDRGQNVRTIPAYLRLASGRFPEVRQHLIHITLPFPHSICILEGRKPEATSDDAARAASHSCSDS